MKKQALSRTLEKKSFKEIVQTSDEFFKIVHRRLFSVSTRLTYRRRPPKARTCEKNRASKSLGLFWRGGKTGHFGQNGTCGRKLRSTRPEWIQMNCEALRIAAMPRLTSGQLIFPEHATPRPASQPAIG